MLCSPAQLFPCSPRTMFSILTLYHKYVENQNVVPESPGPRPAAINKRLRLPGCTSTTESRPAQVTRPSGSSGLMTHRQEAVHPPVPSNESYATATVLMKSTSAASLASGGRQRVVVTCMYLVHSKASGRVIFVTQSIFGSVATETRGTAVCAPTGAFSNHINPTR